ncbi:MAG: hypothetical protein M9897_12070 [Brumimicrobium sp.]|nr:hypothetical protein [Brumimicrobium sp.]
MRYVLTDGNYLLATGFDAKWKSDHTGKIGMPCILKLNKSDGSIVWYKEYKINGSEYVDSYVIRKLGTNYYITGTFNGGGNKSYILCVKESDGSVVWCKTYSTTTSPNFTGMSIDNSNLVVCGVSNNRGFDGDLYVLNVNPSNGNVIWQRKIEKAAGWHYNTMDGDSWGINCVIDPYGDVVIAYEDNPSFDGSSPQRGGLLAKLKMTDGTTKWVKKYRTSDGDGFHGLVISDCNYVASGWFHSTDYNYGLVISDSAGYVGGTYGTLVTKTNSSNSFSEVDVTSTTTVSSLSTNANLSISLSDVSISTSTKKSGSSPTCAIPLPVELLSFTGTPERAGNLLEWVTASETSNAYFEVQATKDGQHFETIGRVNGAGNSTERIAYSFLDRNPSAEIMYYRLKQVDYDGAESIHNIISIKRTFGKDITLYPNPSKNILNIEFDAEWSGTYVVSFVSTDGRMINKDIHVETGKNSVQINVNDKLSDGFYQMRLLDEEGNLLGVKKFIKE